MWSSIQRAFVENQRENMCREGKLNLEKCTTSFSQIDSFTHDHLSSNSSLKHTVCIFWKICKPFCAFTAVFSIFFPPLFACSLQSYWFKWNRNSNKKSCTLAFCQWLWCKYLREGSHSLEGGGGGTDTTKKRSGKDGDINPLKWGFINSSSHGTTWFKWLYFWEHVRI